MTSPRRPLLGQAAAGPLMWMFAALISAPLIAACVKGSFLVPGSWPIYVSTVGAIIGALGILVPPQANPPHLRESIIAFGAATTSAVLLVYGSPLDEPGMFFSGIILCCLLIISGWGWLGAGIGTLLVVLRALSVLAFSPGSRVTEIVDLYSIAVLALAAVWLHFGRRLVRNEGEFRQRGRIAVEEMRSRETQLAGLRMSNAVASTGALSALQRILSARAIDASVRKEVRLAEANLRDHIRCPGLEHPLLTPEIVGARRRGADVLLVGASGQGNESTVIDTQLANALATALSTSTVGDTVTLRQLPAGTSPAAVSLLIANGDGPFNLREFTAHGELIVPRRDGSSAGSD